MLRDTAILQDTQVIRESGEPQTGIFSAMNKYSSITGGDIYSDQQGESSIMALKAQTADFSFVIPAGYCLEYMLVYNSISSATCQLSCGTTLGGTDIFANQIFAAGDAPYTKEVFRMFNPTGDYTIYFGSDGGTDYWGGASIDVYIIIRKII